MLNIRNLTLLAEKKVLINKLDWQISSCECWVIFGRNGIGKTTLLRTLAGLRPIDSGEILLKEKNLQDWKPLDLACTRSYLPQVRHDAFSYSVLQTVLAGRHPYHGNHYWETEKDTAAAYHAMEQMNIITMANRDIRSLSGGERQRVALATVLAQDTPLLLLDEPINSLDISHQVAFMKLARELCKKQNKSIVMVMHDLNMVHGIASHVLLLGENGHWHTGTVPEVMRAETLSRCLGYPIQAFMHEDRTVYVPQ